MKGLVLVVLVFQISISCAPLPEETRIRVDPEKVFDDAFIKQIISIVVGLDKGKQQEMFDGYSAELKRSPDAMDIQFYYALTLKNREEAWGIFNQIATGEPHKYYGHLGKAIIETEWKVFDKAEQNLLKAVKIAPQHFLVKYFFANFYFKKGEFEKAIEYLSGIGPKYSETIIVLNLFGLLYYSLEKYDVAEKYFKRSNEIDPAQYTPHFYLGAIYEKQNRPEDSFNEYRLAVEVKSSSKEAMLNLASTAEKLDKIEDAANLYEKIADQWPNESVVYIKLIPILEKIKAEDRLLKALEDSTSVIPDNADFRLKLATIYFQRGDMNKSEEEYKAVAKIKGNSPEIYVWLGRIAKKREDYKRAMESFLLALKESPDYSDAKSEMAELKKRFKITETTITGKSVEAVLGKFSTYVLKSYKELLKERPKMKGKVSIAIVYDANGNVTEVSFEKNTVNDPVLEACIYGNALMMRFPTESRGSLGYEMEFNPAK